MRLEIAERLHPYSHRPGVRCLIPGSTLCIKVFPARLEVVDLLDPAKSCVVTLRGISGPVQDFTVMQDLEHSLIKVWGQSTNGYFRYLIVSSGIVVEKEPKGGLQMHCEGSLPLFSISKTDLQKHSVPETERLSLGCHKAQDWELICRRLNLIEIVPHWLRLGQMTPATSEKNTHPSLLQCAAEAIEGPSEKIVSAWRNLFQAGFEGILVPRAVDTDYHGFDVPPMASGHALSLLTQGAAFLRRLFVSEQADEVSLLPHLPPEFVCGRYLSARCQWGHLDFEWTKKLLRRAVIYPERSGTLQLQLQKSIRSFRLRRSPKERGQRVAVGEPLHLEADKPLYIDRIEK
jgi:hypothetical protein